VVTVVSSSDFFRYFSLGDKLGQGASAKVFKGVIKKTKKGSPPMVCAIKRVRKFQLKDRKKQALLREVSGVKYGVRPRRLHLV